MRRSAPSPASSRRGPGETVTLPFDRFQQAVEAERAPPRPAHRRRVRRGLPDPRADAGGRPAVARGPLDLARARPGALADERVQHAPRGLEVAARGRAGGRCGSRTGARSRRPPRPGARPPEPGSRRGRAAARRRRSARGRDRRSRAASASRCCRSASGSVSAISSRSRTSATNVPAGAAATRADASAIRSEDTLANRYSPGQTWTVVRAQASRARSLTCGPARVRSPCPRERPRPRCA